MPTPAERERARQERAAKEQGKAIPHYAKELGRELTNPGKKSKVAPSKKSKR